MTSPSWLPTLNTSLIGVSGLFLALGYYLIRHKQVEAHRRCMITATGFSALFLLVYVGRALLFEPKLFAGEGLTRAIYLAILGSHTILAIVIAPLVLLTLRRALRGEFIQHRQLARITAPTWAYVIVTGWLIYLMLHHLWP